MKEDQTDTRILPVAVQKSRQKSTQEHVLPFRYFIQPRESTFTLKVPNNFCFSEKTHNPNYLYFSKLDIIPDFFNDAAEISKLDSNEEDNTEMEFSLELQLVFGPNQYFQNSKTKRRAVYVFGKQNQKTTDFVRDILFFFANAIQFQPAKHNLYNPLFFDWTAVDATSENMLSHNQLINEFIPANLNLMYNDVRNTSTSAEDFIFDKSSEPTEHSQYKSTFFHPNCYDLPGVNPWKFPTVDQVVEDASFRIRLHLQPRTRVSFSNFALLQVLGFEWEDPTMGNKLSRANNQYSVVNTTSNWLTWTATLTPKALNMNPIKEITFASLNPLVVNENNYIKKGRPIQMSLQKTFHMFKAQVSDSFVLSSTIAKQALSHFRYLFNLDIQMDFNNGKIFFPEPDGDRLASCRLYIRPIYIMKRLGYRPFDYLDHKSEHMSDAMERTLNVTSVLSDEKLIQKHQKARDKAEILVFDCGAIHVTSKQGFSEGYSNLGGQFVASLKPKSPGIMTLEKPNQFLRISECQASINLIPLTFQLNTFVQTDESVLLNWVTGATIHGILKSIPAE